MFRMHASRPAHLLLLDSIALIIANLVKVTKCEGPHYTLSFSLLLLALSYMSVLFSNTLCNEVLKKYGIPDRSSLSSAAVNLMYLLNLFII